MPPLENPAPGQNSDASEELLFECLEVLEQKGESGLEDFFESHPGNAAVLRKRVQVLRQSGLIEGAEEEIPERLGDFRILERLGEGGMGVVYRAQQISLGREVALKLIRPDQIYFGNARERFRLEVETIASLQHPGIVAVHAVGEESGIPYFVMELLRGRSIDVFLTQFAGKDIDSLAGSDLDPSGDGGSYLFHGTWEQACMRIIRQVCEALQFAHDRGVLHRDLKPSNIMIASEGSARALLLDFGLARSTRSNELTRTGSQLGSLRYMAPELVRGEQTSLGPATDVYGLGVTLFEMLTLAPAFTGDPTQVALAVTGDGLPRLRTRQARASWEAETILAKATDPDPARRYSSAADLARDLANALERRPIEARQPSVLMRFRRWAQRHPARALASAMGLVLFVGVPLGYARQERLAARAIAGERDAAITAYQSAMDAVGQMLSRVGGDDLAYVPAMEELRERLLEDAVALLERVVADGALHVNRDGRVGLAKAHAQLGQLLFQLGRPTESRPQFEESLGILDGLVAANGTDEELELLRALTTTQLANACHGTGDLEHALLLHERLQAELAAKHEGQSSFASYAASNQLGKANTLEALGRNEEAIAEFETACAALERNALEAGASAGALVAAANGWNQYGRYWLNPDAQVVDERAFPILERALEFARESVAMDPGPQNRRLVCSVLNNLSGAYRRTQEFDEAEGLLQEAREELEALVLDHPSTLSFELELAAALNQMGLMCTGRGLHQEALPYYEACAKHVVRLCELAPKEAAYHHRSAVTYHNVSTTLLEIGADRARPIESTWLGIASIEKAMKLAPEVVPYWHTTLALYSLIIGIHLRQGEYQQMLEASEEMLEVIPDLGEAWHRSAYHHAAAIEMVLDDEGLSEAQQDELIESYAERSCELTRRAVGFGANYTDLRLLKNLEPLHGMAIFEELCKWFDELRGAAKPAGQKE